MSQEKNIKILDEYKTHFYDSLVECFKEDFIIVDEENKSSADMTILVTLPACQIGSTGGLLSTVTIFEYYCNGVIVDEVIKKLDLSKIGKQNRQYKIDKALKEYRIAKVSSIQKLKKGCKKDGAHFDLTCLLPKFRELAYMSSSNVYEKYMQKK